MLSEKQLSMIYEDCSDIIQEVGNDFRKLEGKSVLITGANGMLASFFVDTIVLLNKEYFKLPCKIIAMIRNELCDDSRLWHLKKDSNIKFVVQDVSKNFKIAEKVDYIIHAASKASPKFYLNNPIDTISSNINALKIILEYSIDHKIEGLLYFSSAEIYGNPDYAHIPTSENYEGLVSCTNQRACYTETKRFCETMVVNYSKVYNIPAKIVRPWHVFGLGLKLEDGRVIADFIKDGINLKDIEVLSNGMATRSFCYMTDAHVLFWKIIFSDFNGEAFNVGSDLDEIKIKDLAKMICNIFNNEISYVCNNDNKFSYLNGSPDRCCPDINKAKKFLNYEPKKRLSDWLSRMIRFYIK